MSGVYGGVTATERTAARRARLLEAGLQILGTKGWAQLSVRGVCREAQLTTRFFYESFTDLDALAVAVYDDLHARASTRMLEAVADAGADPHAQAHAAIDAFVRELTDDPRRGRVLVLEALGSPPMLQRRHAAMRDTTELIAAIGRATYAPPPEADRLVDLTATLLAGGMGELLVAWMDGTLGGDRDTLVDDIAALFMATVEGAGALARRRVRHTAGHAPAAQRQDRPR
jgi:AcrR family transcriptional regulator